MNDINVVFGNFSEGIVVTLMTLKGMLTLCFISVLSDNHFSGVVPKELGELNRLEVLDLRDNKLIGNIPPEIGRMQSLTFL